MDRRRMHSLLFHRINDHVNVNLSQSLMSVIYPIKKKKNKQTFFQEHFLQENGICSWGGFLMN